MKDSRTPMPVLYLRDDRITWYCLGDPEETARLLQSIRFLGKHAGAGEGRVWWEEPAALPEDRSVFDGTRLVRAIPAGEAEEIGGTFEHEWRALRPPYWDVTSTTLCAVRGAASGEMRDAG